jgi:ceramide glucosyltransferase
LLAIVSTIWFYVSTRALRQRNEDFLPPISCLKPVRGLDPDFYENFASFCNQDYPDYELVFCADEGEPAVPAVKKLMADFPNQKIRLLYGSGRDAINDKVARLVRLVNEAKNEHLVITDADVRVRPDYLRSVIAPFRDPKVGVATCMYGSTSTRTMVEKIQSIGMLSDFFAGILVAWRLDGVKFTLAQTIVTTRKTLEGFGGYEQIEDRPADDLLVGKLAVEQGLESVLLPYVVHTVSDFHSLRELLYKRTRWMTVMRRMRPWGHFGLIFTWGLIWSLVAIAVRPRLSTVVAYFGAYLVLRVVMTWLIGIWGMKERSAWKQLPLIPLWDALAFGIWVASFLRRTIRWRGIDYRIRGGRLVSEAPK